MIRQARATLLAMYLAPDVDFEVGAPLIPVQGRDRVSQMALEVRAPSSGASVAFDDVRVTIDGRPLEPSEAGADIMFDEEGNSFLLVDEARMYRAVKVSEYEGHEMSLSSNSADFSVFAYTFGAFIE